jgi:hypothetical protein
VSRSRQALLLRDRTSNGPAAVADPARRRACVELAAKARGGSKAGTDGPIWGRRHHDAELVLEGGGSGVEAYV